MKNLFFYILFGRSKVLRIVTGVTMINLLTNLFAIKVSWLKPTAFVCTSTNTLLTILQALFPSYYFRTQIQILRIIISHESKTQKSKGPFKSLQLRLFFTHPSTRVNAFGCLFAHNQLQGTRFFRVSKTQTGLTEIKRR